MKSIRLYFRLTVAFIVEIASHRVWRLLKGTPLRGWAWASYALAHKTLNSHFAEWKAR